MMRIGFGFRVKRYHTGTVVAHNINGTSVSLTKTI